MRLRVHPIPPCQPSEAPSATSDVELGLTDFVGSTVVVIDVLRATTTIIQALASGASRVIPCLEVDDALEMAARQNAPCVLGGERGGKKIAGFDLGNSPAEYTPQTVGGKTVIITTTNGTRAMQTCRNAKRVLLGAFTNISVIVDALSREDQVDLVCAGTDGIVTLEDHLFAGAVVTELVRGKVAMNPQSNEAAEAAMIWRKHVGRLDQQAALVAAMRQSHGGKNLVELGFDHDIELAARVDATPILAELFLDRWEIGIESR